MATRKFVELLWRLGEEPSRENKHISTCTDFIYNTPTHNANFNLTKSVDLASIQSVVFQVTGRAKIPQSNTRPRHSL